MSGPSVPGPAATLAITQQPSTSTPNGAAFAQQPAVQLVDAAGVPVPEAGVVVTASIATGGGTLGGAVTATTNVSGTATFADLSITGIVGNRTLNFLLPTQAGATSTTIAVTAGPASQLALISPPSAVAANGAVFAQQPVLQLRDASGNAATSAGVGVAVSIATGGGTIGGTVLATTNGSGVATFTNLSIVGLIGSRTLSFSATGLVGVASPAITITPGAATQLTLSTQPSSSSASGVAFARQPSIQVSDASGNAVSVSGVAVTATIASGGGALGGTSAVTTNATGAATFSNLSLTGTIGDRVLTFSAPSLAAATSNPITVVSGVPTQLSITTQPSTATVSGIPLAPQPVLQLRDSAGNAVSLAGYSVTAAIATGGGTLGGATSVVTSAAGAATFGDLFLTGTPGDRTLSFGSPGLTGTVSNAITITPPPATQLSVSTQPSSSATAGVAFAQQPVLQLRDAGGNAVGQAGVIVTAAIAAGGGMLGGTVTATTNASGVATFVDLSLNGTTGASLVFSATGLASVTVNTITITPATGSATQLTITTQPSATAASGAVFAQQPTVQLRDASGNAVSQPGVSVTASIATGGGTLATTVVVATNASGI
ncbi:MAG TPA: carboxypeptidase-like regulatory domain-containing protein, partial [Gemmatimonadaceae bacterium]|nr:carboxypeptidase-like regulatory domain-containing protein [Gemmatimonadaceae bacterium]